MTVVGTEGATVTTRLTTDRQGLEVLSHRRCVDLLTKQPVGRVAIVQDGTPLVFPVTYAWVAGSVVFRTAPGSKLAAATEKRRASFEIDSWDPETHQGWSVLVTGWLEEVTAFIDREVLEELNVAPWAAGIAREDWVRLRPEQVSGRALL